MNLIILVMKNVLLVQENRRKMNLIVKLFVQKKSLMNSLNFINALGNVL